MFRFIAPVVGGAGSAIGGMKGASAASDAAKAQMQAAQLAAQTQLYMYNQQRQDLMPYLQAGYGGLAALQGAGGFLPGVAPSDPYALGQLQNYLQQAQNVYGNMYGATLPYYQQAGNVFAGAPAVAQPYYDVAQQMYSNLGAYGDYIRTQGLPGKTGYPVWMEGPIANFKGSPDYQWAQSEAQRITNNTLNQQGLLGSGGQMRALSTQAAGLASQNFQNYIKNIGSQWAQNVPLWGNAMQTVAAGEQGLGTQLANLQNLYGTNLMATGAGLGNVMGTYGQDLMGLATAAGSQYTDYLNRIARLAGYGTPAASQLGQTGTQLAQGIAKDQIYGGQAIGAGMVQSAGQQANALQGLTGGIAGAFSTNMSPYYASNSGTGTGSYYSGMYGGYGNYPGYAPGYTPNYGYGNPAWSNPSSSSYLGF